MLVLVCGVLAVLSPLLFGGDLRRFGDVRLRAVWLPVAALVAQIAIIEIVPGASKSVLDAIHLATYVAAGLFIVVNWRVPGLLIVALGGALNGVTIALNGGTLPASADALRAAGFPLEDADFVNSGVLAHPVLPVLGDIFAWPAPLPLSNVFSFGDVLIVVGAGYGAHRIAGSRLVRRAWQPEVRDNLGQAAPDVPASSIEPLASAVEVPGTAETVGFAPADSLTALQRRLAHLESSEVEARRRRVSHGG